MVIFRATVTDTSYKKPLKNDENKGFKSETIERDCEISLGVWREDPPKLEGFLNYN